MSNNKINSFTEETKSKVEIINSIINNRIIINK